MAQDVLVVDDDSHIRALLAAELTRAGYVPVQAVSGAEAIFLYRNRPFQAVILDINLPHADGYEVLREIRNKPGGAVVLMMTAYSSIEGAVKAIKMGADDYIEKPFEIEELLEKLEYHLRTKLVVLGEDDPSPGTPNSDLVGNGKIMTDLKRQIQMLANSNISVLITGESGTGKGVVARAIHSAGNRRTKPFVYVNCSALPTTLIESELFGFEKGAFTNAVSMRKGKFELAADGTVFLDEIGTLPLDMQAKFLSVLQERQFSRIGGERDIPVQARVLAATNEDLMELVEKKQFREDLYYRLSAVTLECPPLRLRKDDIRTLAQFFIQKHAAEAGKSIRGVEEDVWVGLQNYKWPGNVRELENVLRRAIVFSEGAVLSLQDMPAAIRKLGSLKGDSVPALSLKEQEFRAIIAALEDHGGHREKTAKALGISRRTLQYRLKEYDLLDYSRKLEDESAP